MSQGPIYSWYDVRYVLHREADQWPDFWVGVDVTIDEILVYIHGATAPELESLSWNVLRNVFGERFDADRHALLLESMRGQERLMSVSLVFEPSLERSLRAGKPLFTSRLTSADCPAPFTAGSPPVIAFYSYKGGVGRTLSLIALARAIADTSRSGLARQPKLLLVDADFEAPGLTWLARAQGGFRDFSLLDGLTLIHSADDWKNEVLPLIASKIQEETLRIPVGDVVTEHWFVPAFRYDQQLLELPIEPKYLLQGANRHWLIGDFLNAVGTVLGVDAVLVDLRAGVSELAAPFLLDPRLRRFLVTTTSTQSVRGTELVLSHLNSMQMSDQPLSTPTVFLSMVPRDLDRGVVEQILERLQRAYPTDEQPNNDVLSSGIPVWELPFNGTLVHLDALEDISGKLQGSDMARVLLEVASDILGPAAEQADASPVSSRVASLERLRDICKRMEYAERGEADTFLQTIPLRALAQKFVRIPPAAVVMGGKGAGKTFTYLQLLRAGTWTSFTELATGLPPEAPTAHYIYPLLASRNLTGKGQDLVTERVTDAEAKLRVTSLLKEPITDSIQRAFKDPNADQEIFWREFWLAHMARSIGVEPVEDPLGAMQQYLESMDSHVSFVVDGLEDAFPNVHEERIQQVAVRALCQGVIERLQGLPKRRVGLVVFVRRDIAGAAIWQNYGQFQSLYESFELRWSPDEALRLVLWTAIRAGVLQHDYDSVPSLGRTALEQALQPLWGRKMGPDTAREAVSSSWVLAALSDLRGRLQARDVVRFLRYAASESMETQDKDKIRTDRLLQVSAIKGAIAPCGIEKVKEIEAEIPALKPVFSKIAGADPSRRKIPFQRGNFGLEPEEVRLLEEHGIVIEEPDGFYTSEIYRQGLQLTLDRGARPRVVVLLRRALGR